MFIFFIATPYFSIQKYYSRIFDIHSVSKGEASSLAWKFETVQGERIAEMKKNSPDNV